MLDRFYLIVDTTDNLRAFLDVGVLCVQLRIKEGTDTELRSQIGQARDLCREYGCTLVINDHWKLAIEEGCSAVHLGQEDLDSADVATIKAQGLRLGISTHDKHELTRALSHAPDYIALGPIYQTILKKMPWRPQGLEKLTRWKQRIGQTPLVAIGGFTPERASGAFSHGADSVCVVTDVLLNDDPVARCRQWLEATQVQLPEN